MPGNWFIDWRYTAVQLKEGEAHAGNELMMSEGYEDRFSGKIPADCIGLISEKSREDEDWDVILLDVKYGIIHWMNCPAEIQATASPQSREAMDSEEEDLEFEQAEEDGNTSSGHSADENKNGQAHHHTAQEADNEDERKEEKDHEGSEGDQTEEDEDDEQYEDYDLEWDPSWSVCNFFEMLKNQFRMLNFMPTGPYDVIDIWNDPKIWIEQVPENIQARVQSIYHDHGWPDAERFDKNSCLARIKAS